MTTKTYKELREYVACFRNAGIDTIYLHWSASGYDTPSDAYHISITGDGVVHVMHPLDQILSATWRRNTGSIAVSIMCCYDAVAYNEDDVDFGSAPPTNAQLQAMARVICVLCEELELPIDDDHVLTHAEIADIDGYGINDDDPEMRWDLLLVQDNDGVVKPGGQVLRGMALWYHYNPESIQ